ncbi:hypothetical protein [Streptomyces sp. NPDC001135]
MSLNRPAARRLGLLGAATVAALVPVVGVMPAAMAAPASAPLSISHSTPSPDAPLSRGYSTSTIELAVADESGTARDYTGLLEVSPVGPRGLDTKKVTVGVKALNAPSVPPRIGATDHGTVEADFGPLHTPIRVPAHTTYRWRITLGATPSFPRLDRTGLRTSRSSPTRTASTVPWWAGPTAPSLWAAPPTDPGRPRHTVATEPAAPGHNRRGGTGTQDARTGPAHRTEAEAETGRAGPDAATAGPAHGVSGSATRYGNPPHSYG